MVSRRDYAGEAVQAARSVMLELTRLLGEYRQSIVVVGGWVPELLLGDAPEPHVGSLDVDLALDHRAISDPGYRTIEELLLSGGYVPDERQPFIYHRRVGAVLVEVDLLAGEYEGTGRAHRTQPVQDARPRKARGCDLAFDAPREVRVDGALPDGSLDSAVVRVAPIVPFIVMKAMAMESRLKEKDAYDVHYCLRFYPGGTPALAAEFGPLAMRGLVTEALGHLAEKFASPDHIGPQHVASFLEAREPESRALILRDAYERVRALLDALGWE